MTQVPVPPHPRTLSALLRDAKGPLIARWCQRVLSDPQVPEADRRPIPALQDHIPELIDRLAETLERFERTGRGSEQGGRDAGHEAESVAHARDRFLAGYAMPAALRELSHFRAATVDLCEAEGIVPPPPEVKLFHAAIDEAMSLAAMEIHRAAQADLRRSEARYRFLAEAMPQVVWTARSDGTLDYENGMLTRYVGRPAGSGPTDWFLYVHPDDAAPLRAAWEQALRRGELFEHEHRLRGADGVYRWFLSRAVPMRDAGGAVVAWFGTSTDVDEIKRTQQAHARAMDVLEAGDACLVIDRDWRIVLVNRNQELLSHTERAHTLGRNFWEVFPEAARPELKYWALYHRAMDERVPVQFDEYYAPLDMWTGATVYPTNEGGIAVFFRDVTRERRALDALRRSEARYRLLAENYPNGAVLLFDRDLRYVIAGGRGLADVGLTREGLEGRTIFEALDAETVRVIEPMYRATLRGVPAVEQQPYGGRLYVVHYIPVRDESGSVYAGLVVTQDVSDQQRTEAALRRDAEFRERLLAVLGHDLRQPLSTVAFTASALLRDEGLAPGRLRAVQRVAGAAARMERMVNDLLDFARSRQGGGIPVDPRPVDFAALCRTVIDEIETSHPDRAIELSTSGACEGQWDPDRIAQVVSNLVVNAVHYGAAGTPVRVGVVGDDARVRMTVHNEGPPVPADVLPTVFEAYRRGSGEPGAAAKEGPPRGLGLGLFIAREIVHAHGGTIAATSAAGQGTTFVVDLPRSR